MKFICFITGLLIVWISCRTNGASLTADARSQALGFAGTMLADHATGLSNPAALALLEGTCFSLHAENPWFIPELNAGAFSLCVPLKGATFALSYSAYGYEAYYESSTGLSVGKAFGKKVRAGIKLNYMRIRQFADYGNLHALIPAIGIQVETVPDLILGLEISNPVSQGFYPRGYRKFPATVRAGFGYQPEPEILFCFEFSKETGCKPAYCGGIEYNFEKQLAFRMGISSSSRLQYSCGIGLRGKHLNTDLSVCHHPVLGYSPAITITCFF